MRLIFWFLCCGISLNGKPLDVTVSAKSAILMNAETGAILYEKHAHIPAYPASTTKIATALFTLERGGELDRMVAVSAEALRGRPATGKESLHPYRLDSDGTMMGIKRGEVLSLDSLLHGLMLVSGNDAANVIAESVAGSIPQFMELLNEYLQSIGCKNTQFQNPHGLPHVDHWSTAYDMALMTKRALQIPKFRNIVSTLVYNKPKTNKQPPLEIRMTNPLVKPKSKHYYPKAIGVKTGHTNAAQDTLVAAAEQDGRTLIAVVLGCEKGGKRFDDVKRLFETAFNEKKSLRRLMGPEHGFVKEVVGAKSPMKAALGRALSIEFFPAEEPKCKAALHWSVPELPIRKGQKVGEVVIQDENGLHLQQGDLLAVEEVRGTFCFMMKQRVKRWMGWN